MSFWAAFLDLPGVCSLRPANLSETYLHLLCGIQNLTQLKTSQLLTKVQGQCLVFPQDWAACGLRLVCDWSDLPTRLREVHRWLGCICWQLNLAACRSWAGASDHCLQGQALGRCTHRRQRKGRIFVNLTSNNS